MKVSRIFLLVVMMLVLASAIYAVDCWDISTEFSCDTETNCTWQQDPWGGWCEEKNCWSLWTQDACQNSSNENAVEYFIDKTCNWFSGSSSWCMQLDCWAWDGLNESACVNNSRNIKCEWQSECVGPPEKECWSYIDSSACTSVAGCNWGMCYKKDCWDYSGTNYTTCTSNTGFNGKACKWNTQYQNCYQSGCWDHTNITACQANSCHWESGSCYDNVCSDFSSSEAACTSSSSAYNLSCEWSNNWCQEKGCWNTNNENDCNNEPNCVWESHEGGWCESVECWSFDNMSVTMQGLASTNESYCINNSAGLSCAYEPNGGWCFENVTGKSCGDIMNDKDCMDTFYCFWNHTAGTCNDPQSGVIETEFNAWNPGCYIFDNDLSVCNSTIGCYQDNDICESNSTIMSTDELNCTLITNQSVCGNIPALSTCCVWEAGQCVGDKFSTVCKKQMQEPPEGAYYCEDYNAYTDQSLCLQIANEPWYMPCKWNTSTERCVFQEDKVFGTSEKNILKIDNQQNCKASGGIWITEKYCEGSATLSTGRCEMRFDQERNCNKECYACNYKTDKTNWSSSEKAKVACIESLLGFCRFNPDENAPNGLGLCKANEDIKNLGSIDCNTDCGVCTFLGDPTASNPENRPSYHCTNSKAKCKWISDPAKPADESLGKCGSQGEKTCESKCDKCYTEKDCTTYGGKTGNPDADKVCKWDNGICVLNVGGDSMEICWDGVDNNADGKMDCADSMCFSDPFCGFASGDCFIYDNTNKTECESHSCTWINETWGSWCDMKAASCWKKDGTNETYCEDDSSLNDTCEWHSGFGGFCEEDWEKGTGCMGKNKTDCDAADDENCTWVIDDWCSSGGGLCDPDPNYQGSDWYDCAIHDDDGNVACELVPQCNWYIDSWCQSQGDTAGFCDHKSFSCWQYDGNEEGCTNTSNDMDDFCTWDGSMCYGMMMSGGSGSCWDQGDPTSCTDAGCNWMSGFCDPTGFGGEMMPGMGGGTAMGGMGMQCFMYDGDETACDNVTGCGWFAEKQPFCDINFSSNCPMAGYNETVCSDLEMCTWNSDANFCDEKPFECFWNQTLQINAEGECNAHPLCVNDSEKGCVPKCFGQLSENDCIGESAGCRWLGGWCNPGQSSQIYAKMEGEPIMLGSDPEGDTTEAYVDINGFGMKEMGENFAFGITVKSLTQAAMCNGIMLMTPGQSPGQGTTGQGTNTSKFYWYIDTDGDPEGDCASKDGLQSGFEFFFSYVAMYDPLSGSVNEQMTRQKCSDGVWSPAEIPTFNVRQMMCNLVQGGMIAMDRSELEKYSDLYNSSKDLRVYVATADASGNSSDVADYIDNAGYATSGAFDFFFDDFNIFKSEKDLTKKAGKQDSMGTGGLKMYSEADCWTEAGCYDWSCLNHPFCLDKEYGVHSGTFTDTKIPKVEMMYKESYPDSAFIAFFTDKPANYTFKFYNNDSTCSTLNTTIKSSAYALPHKIEIYNGAGSLAYGLSSNTKYFYKMQICDSSGKCGESACSSFITETASSCGFCNFVTIIDAPEGWDVHYDLDTDENKTYEHWQGHVCSPDAGLKTNYTSGRKINIRLTENSTDSYIEFVNCRVTKSGLRPNARTISAQSDALRADTHNNIGYVGMIEDTRDRIVNNLFPEKCFIRLHGSGTCTSLYHCDNDFDNCVDRKNEAEVKLNTTGSNYCIWEIPCEFSVWAGGDLSADVGGGTLPSSSSGGGSSAGGGIGVPSSQYIAKGLWQTMPVGIRTMNIRSDIIPFTKLEIDVKSAVTEEVSITVQLLQETEKPSVGELADAKVNSYLEVTKTRITDSHIRDIKIRFKVLRTWFTENSIASYDDVLLYRYSREWTALPIQIIDSDDDYIYYEATSSGFSYFAIAEKIEEVPVEEPEVPVVVTDDIPITGDVVEEEPELEPEKNNYMVPIIALVIAVAAIFILLLAKAKKKQPEKNNEEDKK